MTSYEEPCIKLMFKYIDQVNIFFRQRFKYKPIQIEIVLC